jgi:hypothetical protein
MAGERHGHGMLCVNRALMRPRRKTYDSRIGLRLSEVTVKVEVGYDDVLFLALWIVFLKIIEAAT